MKLRFNDSVVEVYLPLGQIRFWRYICSMS